MRNFSSRTTENRSKQEDDRDYLPPTFQLCIFSSESKCNKTMAITFTLNFSVLSVLFTVYFTFTTFSAMIFHFKCMSSTLVHSQWWSYLSGICKHSSGKTVTPLLSFSFISPFFVTLFYWKTKRFIEASQRFSFFLV